MFRSARDRRRFLTWLSIVLFGAVIGYFYVLVVYRPAATDHGDPWQGARAGVMIAAATAGFEIYILDGRFGAWLRRLPFLALLAVREAVHMALITSLLLVNIRIGQWRGELWTADALQPGSLAQDIVFSFVAMGVALFVLQMRDLVGGRTLRNFILGRYHRPISETRVFLVVDLVGSSPIAEKLGNERFHAFLARFFFDIDGPIVDQGGEVYTYVGDAVIASWPAGDAENRERALAAMADVFRLLEQRRERYLQQFGVAPQARAALHVGPVVAGECGDSRRQITYLGDTLNAVSRLEGLAKQLGAPVVASRAVVEGVAAPAGMSVADLGERALAGFAETLGVVALRPIAP